MPAQSYKELKTIRDLIRYAVSCFNRAQLSYGHGNDNAWDEAVYLVLERLNLPIDQLEPYLDARVLSSERSLVIDLIHQRASTRMPLAYLLGVSYLAGLRFLTDGRVFIPRSPIANLLVDNALAPWIPDNNRAMKLLNLCSGSGALAVLMAKSYPQSVIDASDVSKDAVLLTQRNAAKHGLEKRINVIESDLFSKLKSDQPYDVIICNPPYVTTDSLRELADEYRHEPALALHGGKDGMDLIRKILRRAPQYLNDNGIIVIEIGFNQENFHKAFPRLEPIFLVTGTVENSVILLTKKQLKQYQESNNK